MTDSVRLTSSASADRLLWSQVPGVAWSTDLELRVTALRGGGLESHGLPAGEAVGLRLADVFGITELASPAIAAARQALDGTAAACELEWQGRAWDVRMAPLRDAAGAVQGTLGFALDVTHRKREDAERDALEARMAADLDAMDRLHALSTRLVEAKELPAMLSEILDATIALQGADLGEIQLYDPETETLSIVMQRGFGQEFLEHFRVVDSGDDSACGRALRLRERIVIEDVQADPDFAPHRGVAERAGFRAVQSTPIFGREGEPKGVLSTHFRQPYRPSEHELRLTDLYMRLAAELFDRQQHEEALREAMRMAEQASQAKSQFLAVMSHELRTPLTVIIGLSDLMVTEVVGPMTGKQKECASRIKASAWHLVSIINEILTFARSEAGREEARLAEVDVAGIAREVADLLASQAEARGLVVRVHGAVERRTCQTDADKVRQILTNLLGNAVKYTDAGAVEVELDADEDWVEVRVRDTGPGIPAERLADAFEPFVQLDSPHTRASGGTGLGLAISRRLSTLLGGQITVQSAVGQGSTFTLRLPRQGPAVPA